MRDAVVCIPWRDSGEPHRQLALDYALVWWKRHGFSYAVAGPPGGPDMPFNISAARNNAARIAQTVQANVLIFADADTVPGDAAVIHEAVREALWVPGAIYPHDRYWQLTASGTKDVLDGKRIISHVGTEGPPNRVSVSGVVVMSVESWEMAGGWDERFVGWGNEDVAMSLIARDVHGRALRMRGDVYHLWHPRSGYPETTTGADRDLIAAYRAAAVEGPHALRKLRGLGG
jgi:hypothetical protein